MGGFGSTRWGWRPTRVTTNEVLTLDIRVLARRGYFSAGAQDMTSGIEIWSQGALEAGRVEVHYHGNHPDIVTLDYYAGSSNEGWRPVRERIHMDRTACHFGGTRLWFVCPGCGTRRAVLYGVGGLFRCRICQDLAYASTRAP